MKIKQLIKDIKALKCRDLAHCCEVYDDNGRPWLTFALAYGIGPDKYGREGGITWDNILPGKYGLDSEEWANISRDYENAKTRTAGIKAAIKYIRTLKSKEWSCK